MGQIESKFEEKRLHAVKVRDMRATRAVIHLENLRHNIGLVRRQIGPRPQICMAVKADAYGHGVQGVVQSALEAGVDSVAVATVEEGAELREAGVAAPILLLGFTLEGEIPDVVHYRLSPVVGAAYHLELLEAEAGRQDCRVAVHLKIDTGMGRIGCRPEEAFELARRIAASHRLELAGIGTHFPTADMADEEYRSFTAAQVQALTDIATSLRGAGIDPGLVHAANSGGVIGHSGSYFDLVRPGIILYGYYPSTEQERTLDFRPVMGLETQIVFMKRVPAGTGISYGLTYRTSEETTIATIPCGYGDGYSRLLSGKAQVLVNGKLRPIAGRVCMDQTMVDLGPAASVRLYDRVVLFGPDPGAPTAEELASIIGTIPYEITCNINKRVPRVYVDQD